MGSVFEKTISVEEQEKLEAEAEAKEDKEDTWSKLGDTISQFFKPEEEKGDEKPADKATDDKAKKEDKKTDKKKEKKKEPKKPKVETVKEDLGMEQRREDITELSSEEVE